MSKHACHCVDLERRAVDQIRVVRNIVPLKLWGEKQTIR
jgi:hypothetical protein